MPFDFEENVYDGFNRLISTTTNKNTLYYSYYPNGLRASKTVDGITTKFVWDNDQIVMEADGNNNVTNIYSFGINRICSTNTATNANQYYIYNPHGDVQGLTDVNGTLTKTYDYDAFGAEANKNANDTNPFRYCGEYYDKETGNIYLRARYYNHATGSFISEDPVRDGYNWYAYCSGNPVNFIDPSGKTQREDGKYNVETQKKLLQYSLEYNKAKRNGDQKGMLSAARKAQSLRVKENEANFLRDGNIPNYWDMATQAAFVGANTAGLKEGSLEYGEFIAEFLTEFDKSYDNIELKHDLTMIGMLIGQINSNMQQCFVADTLVLTQNGYEKIQNIEVGDFVLSENTETGEIAYKKVLETFENKTDCLIHIFVEDNEIVSSEEHPYYVIGKGWVSAKYLKIGDKLKTDDEKYITVERIDTENLNTLVVVYNLEVEDWHTYFVSDNCVLVHNTCSVSWSNHGYKHFPNRSISWSDTVKSTKTGSAKYSLDIPDIETFERDAWEKTGIPVNNSKNWKVKQYNYIIGASGGQ